MNDATASVPPLPTPRDRVPGPAFPPSFAAVRRAAVAAITLAGAGLVIGAGRGSGTMPLPGSTQP